MANPPTVDAVVRAFMLPKEFGAGFRLACEGAAMRTAVASMSEEYTLGDWADATVAKYLPANQSMFFLFANPLRACVYYLPNTAAALCRYDALPLDPIGANSFKAPVTVFAQPLQFAGASPAVTSALNAHGAFLAAGLDVAGNTYLWVDNHAGEGTCEVNWNSPALGTEYQVQFFVWNGRTAQPYSEILTSVLGQDLFSTTAPVGGAYMFATITNSGALYRTVTFNINTTGPIWAHKPMSNLSSFLSLAQGIRVNATAVKLQNNASINDKNGKLISATVAPTISWTQLATGFDAVSQIATYTDRPAEKGYYGFLAPQDEDDVSDFYPDIMRSPYPTSAVVLTGFPLIERRPYKVIALSVPIAVGRSFVWDVTHSIEYLTTKKVIEQEYSALSRETLQQAISTLRRFDSDYESPDQLRSLAGDFRRTKRTM